MFHRSTASCLLSSALLFFPFSENMQRSSLLSSATPLSPFSLLPNPLRVEALYQNRSRSSYSSHLWTKLPLNCSIFCRLTFPPLHSTVIEEIVETSKDESEFIEVGYICNVHGLEGQLRVKPNTGFPELRFSKPGRRWLKERVSGKETIREVELIEGRDHPGQKIWIVSLHGIDTVDKAKQLIGSTLLVREEDRPVLDEGEFYTRDLVGLRVILKDTGQAVGTVINVFNSGANDLLQVMLNSAEEANDGTDSSKSGACVPGTLVWVPFVEAIVPDVDIDRREMWITPPKGLLELNLRSDERSKKERRELEWKQRKKATRRLIAAKKKLCEMEQKHIFHGLRFGDKAQRNLLADHIVNINFKLFQHAMQNIETLPRWNFAKFINDNSTKLLENPQKMSGEYFNPCGTKDKPDGTEDLKREGLHIISKGKVAIVIVINEERYLGNLGDSGSTGNSSNISGLQALLLDDERFVKGIEERSLLPLVMVSPAHEIQSIHKLLLDHDYLAFNSDKVWFLEEEKLPVVSSSHEERDDHKILMKSPWEILQSPVGSGGVFSLLSSHNILENLSEMGMEYVQICSLGQRSVIGSPLFFGFVDSCKADIGIKIFNGKDDFEEDFDMIFSMRFLKRITKQIDKIQFHAIPKQSAHVEMVDKEWVDVVPSLPNSYELHCSIYSLLNACSSDKICVMEVTD